MGSPWCLYLFATFTSRSSESRVTTCNSIIMLCMNPQKKCFMLVNATSYCSCFVPSLAVFSQSLNFRAYVWCLAFVVNFSNCVMWKSAEKACVMLVVCTALWCYSLQHTVCVNCLGNFGAFARAPCSFGGNGGNVRSLVQMKGMCVVSLPLKAATAFAACVINCRTSSGKRWLGKPSSLVIPVGMLSCMLRFVMGILRCRN